VSLAEWAQTDAEWFWEVWTVLSAYQEGRQMAAGVETTRQAMQC
jgi:hypothetical protein